MPHANKVECVSLKTTDEKTLVGDYYTGTSPDGVLLIHMMPETRASWDDFALRLQEHGFHVLAIDLRGHGESEGGPQGYQTFSDEEHQSSTKDVAAGIAYLKQRGASVLHIVGASIGANLALKEAVENTEIANIIVISPGFNYRGIEAKPLVKRIRPHQGVLFIAAEDDAEDEEITAGDMARELEKLCSGESYLEIFTEGGHGTHILNSWPDFMDDMMYWMTEGTRENYVE